MDCGLKLVEEGKALRLVTPYEANTWAEATHCVWLAKEINARTAVIITEEYHMPRALLTFVRARDLYNNRLWIYPYTIPDLAIGLGVGEDVRITDYGMRGHVATYDEGVDYLCSLLDRDTLNSPKTTSLNSPSL